MSVKSCIAAIAGAVTAAALSAVPTLADSPVAVPAQAPSSLQAGTLASSVGINASCAKAFLAAHNGAPPQSLNQLNLFIALAPAPDLCSQAAIVSTANLVPPPSDAQITAFAQSVGINATCAQAFVKLNGALPQNLTELNNFMAFAPASDLCSPVAVASATHAATPPTDSQTAAFAQSVGINQTCARAFVAHNDALSQNLTQLNQFIQTAPPEDLC